MNPYVYEYSNIDMQYNERPVSEDNDLFVLFDSNVSRARNLSQLKLWCCKQAIVSRRSGKVKKGKCGLKPF